MVRPAEDGCWLQDTLPGELERLVDAPCDLLAQCVEARLPFPLEVSLKWTPEGVLLRRARSNMLQVPLWALGTLTQMAGRLAAAGLPDLRDVLPRASRPWSECQSLGISTERRPDGRSQAKLYGFLSTRRPMSWEGIRDAPRFSDHLPPNGPKPDGAIERIVALTFSYAGCLDASVYRRFRTPAELYGASAGEWPQTRLLRALAERHALVPARLWTQHRYCSGADTGSVAEIELARPVADPILQWHLPAKDRLGAATELLAHAGMQLTHIGVCGSPDAPELCGHWSDHSLHKARARAFLADPRTRDLCTILAAGSRAIDAFIENPPGGALGLGSTYLLWNVILRARDAAHDPLGPDPARKSLENLAAIGRVEQLF